MFKKGHALLAKAACAFFSVLAVGAAKAAVDDLNSMVDADRGYVITGLGDNGSDVAVVFTNHVVDATEWIVPAQLENVQFLVVGGGGGGGGVATNGSVEQGGAGGGGGGVVTGIVKRLPANAVVDVVVGAGGAGGVANTDPNPLSDEDAAGASHPGGNSIFYVTNVEYIVAYGGGRDLGVGKVGGVGGSNAGNRIVGEQSSPKKGVYSEDANSNLISVQCFGTKGGDANNTVLLASGGGGGAVYNAGGVWGSSINSVGGRGGRGLLSSITGTSLCYGSGASGGSSTDTYSDYLEPTGEGAGAGGYGEFAATDAVANQGGGGGGGGGLSSKSGYTGNGGNGGSGIVVFRFTLPAKPVVAATQDLAYTGGQLRGVYEGFGYTLSGTVTATEIGTYTTTATLDNDYNMWADGTTDRTLTIEWRIWPASFVAANHGYTVRGLGETGEEVAVVFTNHNAGVMTWTPPRDLRSVRFLVVGGGGGGGADSADEAFFGGAGGGGGGVVTGVVSFSKGETVSVKVGAGGAGGQLEEKRGSNTGTFGASSKGGDSQFAVNSTVYIQASGGGRDQGMSAKCTVAATSSVGGIGGSNAGSRGGYTTEQSDVSKSDLGFVLTGSAAVKSSERLGNKGGKGCSEFSYGYPSAGGGGGAMGGGGDAGNSEDGWCGGAGGEGLSTDITGKTIVYGSGGGGASTQGSSGGQGGTGAGNGGDGEDPQGTSAVANQGGGGR